MGPVLRCCTTLSLLVAVGFVAYLAQTVGAGAARQVEAPARSTLSQAQRCSEPAASGLQYLIENVPSLASGRVSYGTTDNAGNQLGVLDPIEDPEGGYLGVYHSPFGSPAGAIGTQFRVSVAHSADLMHWRRVRVLDPTGAAMPTLRLIPGSHGFLLAYEKTLGAARAHFVRIRYYRNETDLLANHVGAQEDLPRRFSPYSNGTPAFVKIAWNGRVRRSTIKLSYHYETAQDRRPGPDREAVGTLRGFRRWTTREDRYVDSLLDQRGLVGNHGDRRQFSFDGRDWRVYEAQSTFRDFATWHVLLYDLSSRSIYPLALSTAAGVFTTSFGNPTVQVMHAPSCDGRILVVTMFAFGTSAGATHPGELIYYQPLTRQAAPRARPAHRRVASASSTVPPDARLT